MNEAEFWEIIESSGLPDKISPDEQCENIIEKLRDKSKEELVSFSNIHRELLSKAYTWQMLKANFILVNYVSDNVFEDFRNWVILNGKQRFYETLKKPDIIANYILVEDPVEEVTGECLLYVCEEAWHGDIGELQEDNMFPEDPTINDEWPPESILQQEFPKLYDLFWDDENMKDLHQG